MAAHDFILAVLQKFASGRNEITASFWEISDHVPLLWLPVTSWGSDSSHLYPPPLRTPSAMSGTKSKPQNSFRELQTQQSFHPFTMGVFKSSWATVQPIRQHHINKGRTHGRERHINQHKKHSACWYRDVQGCCCCVGRASTMAGHKSGSHDTQPAPLARGQPGHGQPWWSGWPLITALLTRRNCFSF